MEFCISIHPGLALAEPEATTSLPGSGCAFRAMSVNSWCRLPSDLGTPRPTFFSPFAITPLVAGGDVAFYPFGFQLFFLSRHDPVPKHIKVIFVFIILLLEKKGYWDLVP